MSTRQRHNWFGKKDLDDFDGWPVIGIAVAAMATTLWQRLPGQPVSESGRLRHGDRTTKGATAARGGYSWLSSGG